MKVNELSKELGIQNKELIDYFKSQNFKISSHMQNVTDEMYDLAVDKFKKEEIIEDEVEEIQEKKVVKKNKEDIPITNKTFSPDEMIPCKSVVPYHLIALGVDGKTVYNWEYYGDIDYIKYSDLQALRKKNIISAPKIIILDEELCYQWRRELGDTYKNYLGVDYPEEFFEVSDDDFEEMLNRCPETFKQVIKITALSMIRNENYPSVKKIKLIDDCLGTCIADFLI